MAKASWAVVNPSQGSGNATVNVSSNAPHTGRNVRTTVLTITAANVEAKTVNEPNKVNLHMLMLLPMLPLSKAVRMLLLVVRVTQPNLHSLLVRVT